MSAAEVRDVVERTRHELARLVALHEPEPQRLVGPEQVEPQPVQRLAVEERRARAADEREDRPRTYVSAGEEERALEDRADVARGHGDVEDALDDDGRHPRERQAREEADRDQNGVLAVGPRVGPQDAEQLQRRAGSARLWVVWLSGGHAAVGRFYYENSTRA